MTETEAKMQLEGEGYTNISTWLDSPNFAYPEHTHEFATTHIILAGDMTVMMNGVEQQLQAGDRIDIPALTTHTAVMGQAGCTYVTGEK